MTRFGLTETTASLGRYCASSSASMVLFMLLFLSATHMWAQCSGTVTYVIGSSTVNFIACDITPSGGAFVYSSSVTYTNPASPPQNWLSVNPPSGTIQAGVQGEIDYDINPVGMPAGDYYATVTLQAAGFANEVDTIHLSISNPSPPPSTTTTISIALPSISGVTVIIDGVTYTSDESFSWVVGSVHTISVPPISGPGGTQVTFIITASDGSVSGNPLQFTVTSNSISLIISQMTTSAPPPTPQLNAAVNAASFSPGGSLAPGVIFSLFGSAMTDGTTASASKTPLPTRLAGATVLVNGIAAPIFYASPQQVNAQFPIELAGIGAANIQVRVQTSGGTAISSTIAVQVTPFSPGILTWDQTGTGPGAILDARSFRKICPPAESHCSPNLASPGETIALYVVGLGQVNGPWASGQPATSASPTTNAATLTIGGIPTQVLFSGLAVGYVGLYQLNATVPSNAPKGNAVPVALTIGGSAANTVSIAIQGGLSTSLADLTVGVAANPNPVSGGGAITSTFTVQNTGNAEAENVTLSDPLPAGFSLISCSSSVGSCGNNGATVTASLGTLASGASVTVVISAMAPSVTTPTTVTNSVSVSTTSAQPNGANNRGSVSITVNPSAVSQGPAITSVSTTSPLPLTPLLIQTTGLNMNAPMQIHYSDARGYSVTQLPIRVQPDGTVVAAVPVYFDPNTGQTTPAPVSLVMTQEGVSTPPLTINILDLPHLSDYGTQLGAISHSFLNYAALSLAHRVNEMQALGGLPGNTVDVSQAVSNLNNLLLSAIEARADIDNVSANNGLVISVGTLPDGTFLQFDQSSLDMMDRVLGMYLTQLGPYLQTPAPAQASAAGSIARSRVSGGGVEPRISPGAVQNILTFLTTSANLSTLASSAQAYVSNDETFLDRPLAVAGGAAGLFGFAKQAAPDNPFIQTPLSIASAGLGSLIGIVSMLNDLGQELGSAAFLIAYSNSNVDPQVWSDAVQAAASANDKLFLDSKITLLNLADYGISSGSFEGTFAAAYGTEAAQVIQDQLESGLTTGLLQSGYLVLNVEQFASDGGFDAQRSIVTQLGAEISSQFTSATQGFAELVGNVSVANSLGQNGALPGVEAYSDLPDVFSTLADSNGNYNLFAPLQDPNFDYTNADFEIVDPVSQSTLNSAAINLSSLTTSSAFSLPTLSGTCVDDDAGDPDSDDPDCDSTQIQTPAARHARHQRFRLLLLGGPGPKSKRVW